MSITKSKMNHKVCDQWNIPIDKLMIWRSNKWTKYDYYLKTTTLRMHQDQLMIISNTKLIESFNMNSKLKGFFKDDIFILAIGSNQEIRKLRFQVKENVEQCLHSLSEHFPVTSFAGSCTKTTPDLKYRNVDDIFKNALENNESNLEVPLPQDYKNFIKLCLLDPTFPQCVSETMKIIQTHFGNNI